MKPKVIRKTVLGGGASLLGLLSLTGVGFSNWVLVKSNADISNIEVSVGENGVFSYDLNDHVTWSFSFPDYNTTYGFYNEEDKVYSNVCVFRVTATLDIRDEDGDTSTKDFYDYYQAYLANSAPTSLTFYSRFERNAATSYVDFTSPAVATVNYSYKAGATGETDQSGSTALLASSSTYIDNKITVNLRTSENLVIEKWDTITFNMTYSFNYSTQIEAQIAGTSTDFSSICEELIATNFTSHLYLEDTYNALSQ